MAISSFAGTPKVIPLCSSPTDRPHPKNPYQDHLVPAGISGQIHPGLGDQGPHGEYFLLVVAQTKFFSKRGQQCVCAAVRVRQWNSLMGCWGRDRSGLSSWSLAPFRRANDTHHCALFSPQSTKERKEFPSGVRQLWG